MSLKRRILDPLQPRRSPDPLRHRGPGRRTSCVACGRSFAVVGRVPKDATVDCPHCGYPQEPDL